MIVRNAKKELLIKFKESGIADPKADVEWLLATLIKCSRTELNLHLNRELEKSQIKILTAQVERRIKREPLQHIFNSTNFYGLEIKTSKAALIPRPETEQLVELAYKNLKEYSCLLYTSPSPRD